MNEEIDKNTKILHIFVCTIYKSATMQKKSTQGETLKTSRVENQHIHMIHSHTQA